MEKIWRIRVQPDRDRDQEAWDRDEVGIWYGAWSAGDFPDERDGLAGRLNEIPAQRALMWGGNYPSSYADTAWRFFKEIEEGDWCVLYLLEHKSLAVAKMGDPVESSADHPMNAKGEVFKFRRLRRETKRTFALAELPHAYRLLPTQGRGNVHRLDAMRGHAELLVAHQGAADLRAELLQRTIEEKMDFLGPVEWESLCLAWLILERNFVPTGLVVGRTLPDHDIVGRSWSTGAHILAQCKKSAGPVGIPDEFGERGADAYYFAYGGARGKPAAGTAVIDRAAALAWARTANGSKWLDLCLGGGGTAAR